MSMKNATLPEIRRPKLKQLLKETGFVRVLEAHNGLSALIANDTVVTLPEGSKKSYDALWESSLTDTASKGLPDAEIVGFESRCENIRQILDVTDKPLIVDGDTGRDSSSFEYMVKTLEILGVSAVIIEDKKFPKRNSLEDGTNQHLEEPDEFARKITRGKKICKTDSFMIIARLESLIAGAGIDDAIQRAECYLNAGADGIMIHSKSKTPAEIIQFCKRYKELASRLGIQKPLVCVPTTYNTITDVNLKNHGVNVIIHANHLLRSAYKAMSEVASQILINDRSLEVDDSCATTKTIFRHVGFIDIKEKDLLYERKGLSAIIPAAGEDSDFEIPKAMLKINDTCLLERQKDILNRKGIRDIFCIRGFRSDSVTIKGINYYDNKDYAKTGILSSLFMAREKMENGFYFLNSDIVFSEYVFSTLQESKADIVLCVDNSYSYHKHQVDKSLDIVISRERTASSSIHRRFNVQTGEVVRIGKMVNKDDADFEFTGLAKFSEKGADLLIKTYNDIFEHSPEEKLHEAASLQTASLTDILQEMISRGIKVEYVNVHKGWIEIHDKKDLELARTIVL